MIIKAMLTEAEKAAIRDKCMKGVNLNISDEMIVVIEKHIKKAFWMGTQIGREVKMLIEIP